MMSTAADQACFKAARLDRGRIDQARIDQARVRQAFFT